MKYLPYALSFLYFWLGNSFCEAQSDARFILLRSGRIIEGKIDSQGRESRIELADGGYFVISSERVEKTFRKRRDVINYKMAVTPLSARQQDELLYWLCDQKAYSVARQHLDEIASQPNGIEGFDIKEWRKTIERKIGRIQSKPTYGVRRKRTDQDSFVSQIDQHLVLGCAISGCHGGGTNSSFQLVDTLQEGHEAKLRNYQSALANIKRLGNKEFLRYVSRKHGSLKRGMFPTATPEYLAIATWVNGLEIKSRSTTQTNAPRTQPLNSLASKPTLEKIPLIPKAKSFEAEPKTLSDKEVRPAAYAEQFVPRDEFDPEIFNRLQAKKWKTPEKKSVIKSRVSSTPQRLISPETTNSKK